MLFLYNTLDFSLDQSRMVPVVTKNLLEFIMGLEKIVLDKIAPILESGDHADFFNGTLFVSCNDNKAKLITRQLQEQFYSRIGVSKIEPGQYAFDFQATNLRMSHNMNAKFKYV